jgi:hypothetical protein
LIVLFQKLESFVVRLLAKNKDEVVSEKKIWSNGSLSLFADR